jgi:hypothetical protein
VCDRYRIVRMFFKGGKRAVPGLSGLTLEQAQAHCADPETSSRTCTKAAGKRRTERRGPWFDGYERE